MTPHLAPTQTLVDPGSRQARSPRSGVHHRTPFGTPRSRADRPEGDGGTPVPTITEPDGRHHSGGRHGDRRCDPRRDRRDGAQHVDRSACGARADRPRERAHGAGSGARLEIVVGYRRDGRRCRAQLVGAGGQPRAHASERLREWCPPSPAGRYRCRSTGWWSRRRAECSTTHCIAVSGSRSMPRMESSTSCRRRTFLRARSVLRPAGQPFGLDHEHAATGPLTMWVDGVRYRGDPWAVPIGSPRDVQIDVGRATIEPHVVPWSAVSL